jgi:hypothetical protein
MKGLAITSEFTFGVIAGADLGYRFQSTIHRLLRGHDQSCGPENIDSPPMPCGWSHQISNGGEPTARYGLRAQESLLELSAFYPELKFELKAVQEGEVGYYTDASAGGAFRLGWINSPFWSYSTSPMHAVNQRKGEKVIDCKICFELYGWGGVGGRAVLYNALLEGQFRHSDVTYNFDSIYHFVTDYSLGATLSVWWLDATWGMFTGRSPEFISDLQRAHTWSSYSLSVRRPY